MFRRSLRALLVAGMHVASCSNDDSDGTSTATAGPSETEPADSQPADTEPTAAPPTDAEEGLTGEGLAIGLLAPSPGLLSTVFQATERGIELAADDIADGGGVLDGPLTVDITEAALDGTEADVVPAAVDGGAQALIGPTGSTDALDYRDAVATVGSISCSPTASVPGLTDGQETFGLFRTALPDGVVVSYLADVVEARRDAEAADAAWNVAIVARSDDYGLSVGNGLAAALQARGFTPTVVDYAPRRVNFVGTADEVTSLAPDLTVIVSYEEGAAVVGELVGAGIAPTTMLGLDTFFRPRIATLAGPGGDAEAVDGFTMVGTIGNRAFLQRLTDADPNAQVVGAAQAYDCAIVLALATQAVADGASASVSEAVGELTAGGTTCTTYADCLDKLTAGDDINYDGVSGNLAIDAEGNPTFGRFSTATIVDGAIGELETSNVDIAELRREQAAYAAAAFNTKLQQALSFLGFYDGPIDGLESPELTAALAAFQGSVGLPPTGVFDAATDEALRAALGVYADLLGATTSELQVLLTELGYYSGPIDGIWSSEVTEAVRALQRDLGVPETGVLDAATIRAIHDRGVVEGSTPTTTLTPETTAAPATTAPPATTTPPTTAPPTTAAPTTAPPTTAAPTTAPPTTAAPETTVAPTVPPTTPPDPTPTLDLFDTLRADPDFSIVVDLLLASGFDNEIERFGKFTVFAPTNAAFAALSADELEALRNDPVRLQELLGYHIAEGEFPSALLVDRIETVNGAVLPITGAPPNVVVDGAPISRPDIFASNGVIQGLAGLLQPPPR
jgi:branched-chain amino acid transport system substrate-binding protein